MKAEQETISLLVPDWPAPSNVLACTTKRGVYAAEDEYSSFNLAQHVNANNESVVLNRTALMNGLALPKEPRWLQQVHGTESIKLNAELSGELTGDVFPIADAAFTDKPQHVCVVMTADCLPLLITDKKGRGVAAIHAGWRGLSNGIIEKTLNKFCAMLSAQPKDCMAWMGPAISQRYFEVGADVYHVFLQRMRQLRITDKNLSSTFTLHPEKKNKYFCDLYALARIELQQCGLTDCYGGEECTYSQEQDYFSYRRTQHKKTLSGDSHETKNINQADTGRMSTLIWLV